MTLPGLVELTEVNTEFLTAEDAALKNKLKDLTVASERGLASDHRQKVGVWYRWPQRSYAKVEWPFLTLDLVDVDVDHPIEHSYSWDTMTYVPDTIPETVDQQVGDFYRYMAPTPVPHVLTYIVATHCRSERHDRELFRQLLQPWLLPFRFGFLEVPTDGTVRRLNVLDVSPSNDLDSLEKRVFRRIFTISVNAEMLPEAALSLRATINNIVLNTNVSITTGLRPPSYWIS